MAETLGKYQLIEKIAQGGMAEVFLASQQSEIGGFSKRVAIKRMFPHLVERDEIITMFIDEARIASSLTHPSIVQIYDLGVVDGALYIAMEYVEGLDLRRLCEKGIEQDNFFSREMAVRIVADTAAGLHYAHTRLDEHGQPMNIVHRDISPQNILISVDGAVKICDFGIAKAESRLTDTLTGEFKGKFSYMSPEQFEGGDLDGQSDVFTLGIVFYEITVGTRLFRGKNEYDTMRMVTDARVTPPTEIRPDFPPDLERIILKSLQRDRRLRYKSAAEFHDDLEDWLYSNRLRVGPMQISRYIHSLLRGERGEDVPAPEALEPAPVKTAQVDETMPLTLSEDLIHELDAHYGVDGPAREDATVQDSVDRTSLSPMPTWENEEAEILGETRPELDSLSLGVEPPTNPIMQSLEEPEEDRTIVLDDIVVEDPTTGHHVKPHQVASALEADSSGKNEQFSTDPLFEIGRMAWTPRHLLIGAAGVAALLSVVMLVFFLFSGGEDLGENGGEGGAEPGSELAVSGNEIPLDDGEILAGPLLSHPTVEVRLESQPSGAYVV
ncbi:MAG: serine/threonine protein kinase, partial [Bradymonadaceae bacterium]